MPSKIVSYTQGYMLMRAAAKEYGWNLNYGGIALMWRGGCLIHSRFLGDIKKAFDQNPNLTNLLLDRFFKQAIQGCQQTWRAVVAAAVTSGIPVPAFSTALAFYDGFRSARLPANLLQAQRDYFARIRTRGSIDRGGNSFTPIGPGTAVKSRRVATTYSGVLRRTRNAFDTSTSLSAGFLDCALSPEVVEGSACTDSSQVFQVFHGVFLR